VGAIDLADAEKFSPIMSTKNRELGKAYPFQDARSEHIPSADDGNSFHH
jgi:hypothetical protein